MIAEPRRMGLKPMRFGYNGDQVIAEYDGSDTLLRKFIYGPGNGGDTLLRKFVYEPGIDGMR